jgi:hypothetical protein
MENHEQCSCVEMMSGDIVMAMIHNGDMDQSDDTFNRRLENTKKAINEIGKTILELHSNHCCK